jgi:selenocysteine lyase/cysteine desulfurase
MVIQTARGTHDPALMLDSDQIRTSFPHLARNVYLNTASAGLSWAGQGTAAAKFYDVKSRGIGGSPDWTRTSEAAKAALGELLGVPAQRIQFVGSTTEALNLIALAMPLTQGDCVVVAEDEFPSVVQPWITLHNSGVRLKRVPIIREFDRTNSLCAAVDSSTRVLAVSHVHWRTGTRIDLPALSAVCRKHDCRLIVDGVQAVGAIPVDASETDAYCASVFKWLLSGFGLAFLVLSDRLANELTPVARGYFNPPPSRALRYGHLNYPGIYALQGTLGYLDSVGWGPIHQQVDRLAKHAIASLRKVGFDVVTPEDSHAGIVSFRHPATSELAEALASQSIFVEDGAPFLRVSPHFYNTEEDVDRLMTALVRGA